MEGGEVGENRETDRRQTEGERGQCRKPQPAVEAPAYCRLPVFSPGLPGSGSSGDSLLLGPLAIALSALQTPFSIVMQ